MSPLPTLIVVSGPGMTRCAAHADPGPEDPDRPPGPPGPPAFVRVSPNAPSLEVDTADGYRPGLDQIVAFVNWFRPVLGGEEMAGIFALHWEVAWDVAAADVAEAFRLWRAECDHARALVAGAPSFDVRGFRSSDYVSLRWVMTHMIGEYARHNGHADLLRERLEGSTGE